VRILLVAANAFAAVLSLVWLWGNSSSLSSGWELWFALGYLLLTLANLAYLIRRGRRHYGRGPNPAESWPEDDAATHTSNR
jgi:hypothetical protein